MIEDGLAPPRPLENPTGETSRSAWLAAAGLAVVALGGLTGCTPEPPATISQIQLEGHRDVAMRGAVAAHLPLRETFDRPVDLSRQELVLKVRLSPGLVDNSVVRVYAYDSEGRLQNTSWAGGQTHASNLRFDPTTNTITLRYRPARADQDRHGHTDDGFDPAAITELGVWLSAKNPAREWRAGRLEVLEARLEAAPRAIEPAVVEPLLRTSPRPAAPLRPAELKSGVSRYFVYGDLERWSQVEKSVEEAFQLQQQNGLTAFRLMGGLDQRDSAELDPAVFTAMRSYLAAAREAGQKHHIFTLLDGAIPNATLEEAMRDPQARSHLVEALRPFVREFGGEPVVFDLVNEIHGVPGVTERQRQELIEDLVELFVEEAPGATLTVGVQNYRELAYWSYLPRRFEGQPVKFLMTFHLYEDIEDIPAAWELNLPVGMEVGITEAAPAEGVERQTRLAAAKGYRWLLFWQDANHRYDPGEHARQVGTVSRPDRSTPSRGPR